MVSYLVHALRETQIFYLYLEDGKKRVIGEKEAKWHGVNL